MDNNTIKMQLPEALQQATLQMVQSAIDSVITEAKKVDELPKYMNQRQAAAYLNIAPATLIKWEKLYKDLPVITIESIKRYPRVELDTWMKEHKK